MRNRILCGGAFATVGCIVGRRFTLVHASCLLPAGAAEP